MSKIDWDFLTDDFWIVCSREAFIDSLNSEELTYSQARALISLYEARFEMDDADPYEIEGKWTKIFSRLAHLKLDELYKELEGLFIQIFPSEGLHSDTVEYKRDVILSWLTKLQGESNLFLGSDYESMLAISVRDDVVDFSKLVDRVFGDSLPDDGLTPEEFRKFTDSQWLKAALDDALNGSLDGENSPRIPVQKYTFDLGDETALHKFGYRVGKSSDQKRKDRRELLLKFLSLDFTDRGEIDPLFYGIGDPSSGKRLAYMATVISQNIRRFFYNSPERYEYAIREWLEDLGYLERFSSPNSWWPRVDRKIKTMFGE